MNKALLKSIGAITAGFVLVVIISVLTDLLLIKTGLMKQPFDLNAAWFIIFVIFYRCLFAASGAYITAKLAPGKPMLHAMMGGAIGFVLSIIGAVAMWDQPPHWYAISLIITALPSAWLGGWLFLQRSKTRQGSVQ